MSTRRVLLLIALLLGCPPVDDDDAPDDDDAGDDDDSGDDDDATSRPLLLGEVCLLDSECASSVCWNDNTYDALCFGAVCSVPCSDSDDCLVAFTAAGAPFPDRATCGWDFRCSPLQSGLGAFTCAR